MADKEKKPLKKKGEEGADEGEDEEEEQGCCGKFCDCLTATCAVNILMINFHT